MAKVDKRETITIKLRPGRDDDLIRWWARLEGNKNSTIKSVLRSGLELPEPAPTAAADTADVEALKGELSALYGELSALRQAVAQVPTLIRSQGGAAPGGPDYSADIAALYAELSTLREWADNLVTALNQQIQGQSMIVDVPADSTPRMEDEKREQRRANMKRQKW